MHLTTSAIDYILYCKSYQTQGITMRGLAVLVGICSVYNDYDSNSGGRVAAFSPSYPSSSKSFANRKLMSITTSHLGMSTPGGGDWDNDDFLNSLGGGSDSGNMDGPPPAGGDPIEFKNPGNDLTDEQITEMAMNSARFYNTDTSIDEAYGSPRQGPPLKQQQDDSGFDDNLEGEFQ